MHERLSSVREGARTTNRGFLVLLEVIIDEAEDERGLVQRCRSAYDIACGRAGGSSAVEATYLAYGGFAEEHQFDTAARLWCCSCGVSHDGYPGRRVCSKVATVRLIN